MNHNHTFDVNAGLDVQVLQILAAEKHSVGLTLLQAGLMRLGFHHFDKDTLLAEMQRLERLNWVSIDRDPLTAPSRWLRWEITERGKIQLAAFQYDKESTVEVNRCTRRQGPEEYVPAVTTICVSEAELDAWWAESDVDLKARVFMAWSLGNERRDDDDGQPVPYRYPDATPNSPLAQAVQA